MSRLRHCGQWVDAQLDGDVYHCSECGNAITKDNSIEIAGVEIRPGDQIDIRTDRSTVYGPLRVTEVTDTRVQMFVEEGLTPTMDTDTAYGEAVLEGHDNDPEEIIAIEQFEGGT